MATIRLSKTEAARGKSTGGVTIEGFLIAVIDCIQAEGEDHGVPEFVAGELQALIPGEVGEMEIAG